MKALFLLLVGLMQLQVFAKVQDWKEFNSSLLIEVTRTSGVFTCTGVAVSADLIVTAAHCLDGDVKSVKVFTQDRYDPKAPGFTVATFKLHPSYNPKVSRYNGDLAKIKLSQRLPETIQIQPLLADAPQDGMYFRFGFGGRNKKNIRTVITPKYRQISGNILELNDFYSYSGDSGGPVFVKKNGKVSLLAIHSTLSFGPEGNFSFNPLLAPHKNWIFEN